MKFTKKTGIVLLCLFCVFLTTAAFNWKGKLSEIQHDLEKVGKKIEKEAEKVEHEVEKDAKKIEKEVEKGIGKFGKITKRVGGDIKEKAQNLSDKIKQKLGDHLFEDVSNTVDNIENKVEEKLEEAKENLSPEKFEEEKQKIMEKASKDMERAIETSTRKKIEDNLYKSVFGQDRKPKENYNYHNDTSVPVILRNNTNDEPLIGGGDHDFAWMRESRGQINELLTRFPELYSEYENSLREIVQMVKSGKTRDEINEAARDMIEDLQSKVPENEVVTEIVHEFDEAAEDIEEDIERFDLRKFKHDIKEVVEEIKEDLEDASDEEKNQLLSFVLASNSNLDDLLKKVEDEAIRERMVKRMKGNIQQAMENNQQNYEEIMSTLDNNVSEIEEAQLVHVRDENVHLRSPYGLKPKQQFTFSVEDIMVDDRADIDFFEFVSMEPAFNEANYIEDGEGYVYVTSETVTGVAPHTEGEYDYKTSLKYTSFRTGGEAKIIDTTFNLRVGEKYTPTTDATTNNVLIYVIAGLLSLAVGLAVCQCYKKIRASKALNYKDMTETSFQAPPRKVEHASEQRDLEMTNSE